MKPKIIPVLERCIEDGLQVGFVRAFKHNDDPSHSQIQNAQLDAIMHEIYEAFEIEGYV